jgi:hypothetical protein
MLYLVKLGLSSPDQIFRIEQHRVRQNEEFGKTRKAMMKFGLITRIAPATYKLNMDMVRQYTYIVSDDLWEQLIDPEVMFKYKQDAARDNKRIKGYKDKAEKDARDARRRAKWRAAKLEGRSKIVPKTLTGDPLETENILFPAKR